MSFWALSKENILERSPEELAGIYDLIIEKIPSLVEKFLQSGVMLEIV